MALIGLFILLFIVHNSGAILPLTFDARNHWAQCPTIGNMPSQGCCACSFAIAPTSVMADRACIASNGSSSRTFSAYHAVVCCRDCALYSKKLYLGGDPLAVWEMWTTTGLASYGCLPYSLDNNCDRVSCGDRCIAGYNGTVATDLVKGTAIYAVGPHEVDIREEIYAKGPVQTTIELYADFVAYKDGIYRHKEGAYLGVESIKLIGWGHNGEERFWLGVASFGDQWGNGGLFQFPRGENYLCVESRARSGMV